MTLSHWWRRLVSGPATISTAAEFQRYVEAQAAYIAQRTLLTYCEVKTGIYYKRLSSEPAFQQAYEVARWETFAAVLADLLVVSEGQLRSHAAERIDRLADELQRTYAAVLGALPRPDHRPDGWNDIIGSFGPRLGRVQLAGAVSPDVIAKHSAERFAEILPIHASVRRGERESVTGAIRFRILAFAEELPRRVDLAAVARALVAASDGRPLVNT